MIELRQLRYLLAAANAGSFSRAARILNIKQATLSRHISYVEQRLNMRLFERNTRGVNLTDAGTTYIRTAQRIVSEFDDLNSWVRETRNGTAGHLAIGFHTSISAGNLRATLSEFTDRHPEVHIRGFERDRDRLLAGLENGLLDLAIMTGEAAHIDMAGRPFWSERILVVLPQTHPLEARDRIYWPDLAGEHFLLTEHDTGAEAVNLLLGKLGAPGIHPHIDVHDISRDSLLSVVALGRHISIIAETALGFHFPGVVFREIHENGSHVRLGFSGYWRPDNGNHVLRRFLDFVMARYSLPPMQHMPRSTDMRKSQWRMR